jgi:hypothetical protein
MDIPPARLVLILVAVAAIGGAIVFGTQLRADDPLSSPVMAAEDPFTHMQLVRSHIRDGDVTPDKGQANYPPGLHSFLGAWWVFTGAPLYDIMRLGPVVFGAVSLVAMAALLGPREGLLAAFVGTLAFAAMPEEVFRTAMMSPTALDMALLPLLLGTLLEVVRGKLAWLGAAIPLTAFLLLAHPWVLAILLLTALLFLGLSVLAPWPAERGARLNPLGIVGVGSLLAVAFAFAAATRWEASGSGFGEISAPLMRRIGGPTGMLLMAVAAGGAVLAVALARRVLADRQVKLPLPRWTAGAVGAGLIAVYLWWVATRALAQGMPDFVDLPRMVGWPVLLLAGMGVLLLPLAGSPVGHVGGALFLGSLPFVLLDPLDSPYWPHRTVAFMGIGLAILAGVAARRMLDAGTWGVRKASAFLARPRPAHAGLARARGTRLMAVAFLVPGLVIGGAAAGLVLADTPEPYPGGWYRLYGECEFNNLRALADTVNAHPRAIVIVGAWEPQLVLSAFTNKVRDLWTVGSFFRSGFDHDAYVQKNYLWKTPTYVVVERHLPEEVANADWSFLDGPGWVKLKEDCPSQGAMANRFLLYQLEASA